MCIDLLLMLISERNLSCLDLFYISHQSQIYNFFSWLTLEVVTFSNAPWYFDVAICPCPSRYTDLMTMGSTGVMHVAVIHRCTRYRCGCCCGGGWTILTKLALVIWNNTYHICIFLVKYMMTLHMYKYLNKFITFNANTKLELKCRLKSYTDTEPTSKHLGKTGYMLMHWGRNSLNIGNTFQHLWVDATFKQ